MIPSYLSCAGPKISRGWGGVPKNNYFTGGGGPRIKKIRTEYFGGRAGYGDPLLDLRMSILSKYCFVIRHSFTSPG